MLYIYDIIAFGSDLHDIEVVENYLKKYLQTKDIGQLRYCLDIKVAKRKKCLMFERKYVRIYCQK